MRNIFITNILLFIRYFCGTIWRIISNIVCYRNNLPLHHLFFYLKLFFYSCQNYCIEQSIIIIMIKNLCYQVCNVTTIHLSSITINTFIPILHFLYTSRLHLFSENIGEIIRTARKLQISTIVKVYNISCMEKSNTNRQG